MLHRAHASRLHWEFVGTDRERSVGEWQVSRVHALVLQTDAALFHAGRSLAYAQRGQLSPFYIAYAHEALARAYAQARDSRAADHLYIAHDLLSQVSNADERQMVAADLEAVRAMLG